MPFFSPLRKTQQLDDFIALDVNGNPSQHLSKAESNCHCQQ
jgi:hypothetical protein